MRLIDADELKKKLTRLNWNVECGFDKRPYLDDIIDNAPTVEIPENAVNCVLTMFGKCSYNETGCSDCEIKDKIRKALNERPQGEWIDYDNTFYKCPDCGYLLEKCCPQCQNKVILPKGGAE